MKPALCASSRKKSRRIWTANGGEEMDPLIELDAITNFIQPFTPTSTAIELLNLPEEPYDGMLVFRFLGEEPRMINAWQSEHIRQWQVLYFHSHIAKVVQTSS